MERRGETAESVPEAENAVLKAINLLDAATDEANRTTASLLDAVDISIAADDEIARLAEWNYLGVNRMSVFTTACRCLRWVTAAQ